MRQTSTVAPPPGVHPVWWALTDVVGLTDAQIRRYGPVSQSVARAAVSGREIPPDSLSRMLQLLDYGRAEMNRDVPGRREVPLALRTYRAAVFALLSDILAEFRRSPGSSAPRTTELARDIAAAVGLGRRRDLVISDLRGAHPAHSIRRAARRLGYLERLVGDHVHWVPPPGAPPPGAPTYALPVRTYVQPTGARQRAAHDALSIYLGRQPSASATAREAVDYLTQRGHSRAMVFRAARELNLTRTTTGFGAAKRSTWALPPAPEPSPQSLAEDEYT